MRQTQIELSDQTYQKVEVVAKKKGIPVPAVLREAVEEFIHHQAQPSKLEAKAWQFPKGMALGKFLTPVEDWRLAANEHPNGKWFRSTRTCL